MPFHILRVNIAHTRATTLQPSSQTHSTSTRLLTCHLPALPCHTMSSSLLAFTCLMLIMPASRTAVAAQHLEPLIPLPTGPLLPLLASLLPVLLCPQAGFPVAQTQHFCNLIRWYDLLQNTADAKGFFPRVPVTRPRYVAPPPPAPAAAPAAAAAAAAGGKVGGAGRLSRNFVTPGRLMGWWPDVHSRRAAYGVLAAD